jgi:hypothetical protein
MIVLDGGGAWQLVLQPHHGDLAGQLAAAWGNDELAAPRARESMALAATRHDDGWAVWERWPEVAPDEERRPLSFLEADIPSHIDFYRAAVTDVTRRDPRAGFLVAMHAAGLYRMRYDTHPQMGTLAGAERHGSRIARFLDDLESSYPERRAECGIGEAEQWVDYRLLQVLDRLSLYFSGFFKLAAGDVHTIAPVPVDYEGNETELRIEALPGFEPYSPTHVRMDPYPFGQEPAVFTLERRLLEKRDWTPAEFREAFLRAPLESVEIRAERAA